MKTQPYYQAPNSALKLPVDDPSVSPPFAGAAPPGSHASRAGRGSPAPANGGGHLVKEIPMRVLLKEGVDQATAASVLILPQLIDDALETLSGGAVPHGIVAEADDATLVAALNTGALERGDEFLDAKGLLKEVHWMSKALADYEMGSKIGLKVEDDGYSLDDSQATRINRTEGLAKDDVVAIGPTIKPRALMNARGRVVSIKGETVEVALEVGDRDRYERASGKRLAQRTTFPLATIEKVPEGGQ